MIIVNPDLRIVHADGPALDNHGYQAEGWPGRLLTDVLPAPLMGTLEPHYRLALAGEHHGALAGV